MKRLLRIAFNQAIFSLIPVLSWIMLGIVLDKNLSNVFSLTYPIQFIWAMLVSIFGTGANIYKEKDKKENAVLSGMTLGIIIGFFIFGFLVINIKNYIEFMHMDYNTYKEFAIYSVIQLYIQLVFGLVMEKLYFEGKEKLANKYMIIINLLNFCVLIGLSLLIKDKAIIVIYTLLTIFVFTIIVTLKQYKKFKFEIDIVKCIKYESVSISENILFFLTYLFGYNNALAFGEEYITALNFVALITDTQWDSFEAIETVTKIDISKGVFNYKEHRRNSYKLLSLLLFTTFIMFILFYKNYQLNIYITMIYLGVELIDFLVEPIYSLKICYLQLTNGFEIKVTSNKIAVTGIRAIISFLNSPFCTTIGQTFAMIEQFIVINFMFYKNFRISDNGKITKKGSDTNGKKRE